MQTKAGAQAETPSTAGHRDLTIEEAMAHAKIKSRVTLRKYIEGLNIQLKKPGIGSKRLYITWDDAELVRKLREDPLRLDELKHPPREEKDAGASA
jgi:hypothetical protein